MLEAVWKAVRKQVQKVRLGWLVKEQGQGLLDNGEVEGFQAKE